MALAIEGVHDPMRRLRLLWLGVCWVLVGVFVLLGSAYAVGGISVSPSSASYQAVQQYVPGGMHTHGGLMLVVGLGLVYGLLGPLYGLPVLQHWVRRGVLGVLGYSTWLLVQFVASWALNGALAIVPAVWWSASLILSVLLVKLPPPTAHEIRHFAGGSHDGMGRA